MAKRTVANKYEEEYIKLGEALMYNYGIENPEELLTFHKEHRTRNIERLLNCAVKNNVVMALEAVADKVSCEIEWGGGISDDNALRSVFNAGATQAVIGSVAALKPDLFRSWLLAVPSLCRVWYLRGFA